MIESAEEFVRLRASDDPAEYLRAAHEPAALATWLDVIDRYRDARVWVAHNKTVPIEALARLAIDEDPRVRTTVAGKRKLTPELVELAMRDADEGVRAALAFNRGRAITRDVLVRLAADPSPLVADAAAKRLADAADPIRD